MFKIVIDVGAFRARFWIPLGGPSGSQKGTENYPKLVPEQGRPQEAPRRPQEGPKWGQDGRQEGSKWACERKTWETSKMTTISMKMLDFEGHGGSTICKFTCGNGLESKKSSNRSKKDVAKALGEASWTENSAILTQAPRGQTSWKGGRGDG